MRIDKRLYLIIPVTCADGSEIFVHSAPISSDVFDKYYLPIAKTFSAMYSQGLGAIAGPRVADKLLRQMSQELGMWDGGDGVHNGLVAEIHRLTNVLLPSERGWMTVPFYDARQKGQLEPEDAAEVEAAIVFFTVASAMHRRRDLQGLLESATSLWGAEVKSLTCTAFLTSLQTLTATESSGGTEAGSWATSSSGSLAQDSRSLPSNTHSTGDRRRITGSGS